MSYNHIHEKRCPSCEQWLPIAEFASRDMRCPCKACQSGKSQPASTSQRGGKNASVKPMGGKASPGGPNRSLPQKPTE